MVGKTRRPIRYRIEFSQEPLAKKSRQQQGKRKELLSVCTLP
jgi:hypothetical protein